LGDPGKAPGGISAGNFRRNKTEPTGTGAKRIGTERPAFKSTFAFNANQGFNLEIFKQSS
jgi:hypothetical protein